MSSLLHLHRLKLAALLLAANLALLLHLAAGDLKPMVEWVWLCKCDSSRAALGPRRGPSRKDWAAACREPTSRMRGAASPRPRSYN